MVGSKLRRSPRFIANHCILFYTLILTCNNMKRLCLGLLFLAAIICGICNNSNAAEGKIRIALYKDGGVSDGYKNDVAVIEQDPTLEYELVNGQQIRDGVLKNFDIVFLPGGSGKGQAASMGEDGVKQAIERCGIDQHPGTAALADNGTRGAAEI